MDIGRHIIVINCLNPNLKCHLQKIALKKKKACGIDVDAPLPAYR